MLRKKRNEKTRFAQTVFRSDRFFPPLLGANQRGPGEPIFDRFAMGLRQTVHEHIANAGSSLSVVSEMVLNTERPDAKRVEMSFQSRQESQAEMKI